jgi:hypothetical protein
VRSFSGVTRQCGLNYGKLTFYRCLGMSKFAVLCLVAYVSIVLHAQNGLTLHELDVKPLPAELLFYMEVGGKGLHT